jgi:hypothetical protein
MDDPVKSQRNEGFAKNSPPESGAEAVFSNGQAMKEL